MSRTVICLSFATYLAAATTAGAQVPRVAVDIAPVHSLVARVMAGLGTPDLIVAQGASPHEYSLRPSEAGALQDADLVFWVGPELTPWLSGAMVSLTGGARVTALLQADATALLPVRDGVMFDTQHSESDDHGHDDHADHGHADGAVDPHAWLSPQNGAAWLGVIAAQLSMADPENQTAYAANAAAGQAELAALSAEINSLLAPVRGGRFVVFHDAYQYFETGFDVPAAGSITLSDASDPSPARIAGVQARIRADGITCVLAEPQFNPGLVATVLDGTTARTGVLDPLASDLAPGQGLYPALLRQMAVTLAECL